MTNNELAEQFRADFIKLADRLQQCLYRMMEEQRAASRYAERLLGAIDHHNASAASTFLELPDDKWRLTEELEFWLKTLPDESVLHRVIAPLLGFRDNGDLWPKKDEDHENDQDHR